MTLYWVRYSHAFHIDQELIFFLYPCRHCSRDVRYTGIPKIPVLNTGIPKIPVLNTGILKIPVLNTGILKIPVLNTGIPKIPVLNTGIPKIPVLNTGILKIPVLNTGILKIPVLNTGIPKIPVLNTGIPKIPVLNTGIPKIPVLNPTPVCRYHFLRNTDIATKISDIPKIFRYTVITFLLFVYYCTFDIYKEQTFIQSFEVSIFKVLFQIFL